MSTPASSFTVSAPGSLMFMGEHAVLNGKSALCMAVNPRISIEVTSREDREIHIESDQGSLHTSLGNLPESHSLRFVLACLEHNELSQGFDATIRSELDSSKGLGTSASVTVALTAALQQLEAKPFDPARIVTQSIETIRQVQGRGSGCDAAASTYGGIVHLHPDPFRIEPIQTVAKFWMAYSGYKTPTPEVIAHVEQLRKQSPELYEILFSAMERIVEQTVQAIRLADWDSVGHLMTQHHYLQAALGTSDSTLDSLVHHFLNLPDILGAKISGSGLGDSVLALGEIDPRASDPGMTPVELSPEGVRFES